MVSNLAWPRKRLIGAIIILLCSFLVSAGFPKESSITSSQIRHNPVLFKVKSTNHSAADSSLSFRSLPKSNVSDSALASKRWLSKLSTLPLKPKKDSLPSNKGKSASEAITEYSSQLTDCYHSILKLNPELHGRITVRILVNDLGKVHTVEILNSAITDKKFLESIVSIIKSWDKLPPAEKNTLNAYRQEFIFGEE